MCRSYDHSFRNYSIMLNYCTISWKVKSFQIRSNDYRSDFIVKRLIKEIKLIHLAFSYNLRNLFDLQRSPRNYRNTVFPVMDKR